jgi:hypothetical protein
MVIRTASVVPQPQIINSWVIYREAVLKRAIQSGEMTEVALRLVKGDELDKAPLNPFWSSASHSGRSANNQTKHLF